MVNKDNSTPNPSSWNVIIH